MKQYQIVTSQSICFEYMNQLGSISQNCCHSTSTNKLVHTLALKDLSHPIADHLDSCNLGHTRFGKHHQSLLANPCMYVDNSCCNPGMFATFRKRHSQMSDRLVSGSCPTSNLLVCRLWRIQVRMQQRLYIKIDPGKLDYCPSTNQFDNSKCIVEDLRRI